VDFTPELVVRNGVRPHADAIGQIGDIMFVGGHFERVALPGGSVSYARQNFFAFSALTGRLKSQMGPDPTT
jgi:hypothetical protein